jgi:hypothetical protein
MSRGLGKLQRDLLEILEESDQEINTITLAAIAYRIQPDETGFRGINDAQHAAVRRALRGLHKRGLVVELGRRHRCNRCHWASLKVGLPYQLSILRMFNPRSAEIPAIQVRMKDLGISPTSDPSKNNLNTLSGFLTFQV